MQAINHNVLKGVQGEPTNTMASVYPCNERRQGKSAHVGRAGGGGGGGVGDALQRADLQQRAEGRAADGAVVGLVAQRVGARVAQAQVPARQDERVAHVAHADHALRPAVLRLLVRARLQQNDFPALTTRIPPATETATAEAPKRYV